MHGNCWAYSSVGALEISYVKVTHATPAPVALSEKQVVACAGAGTCGGGWPYKVFQWMTATHTRIMNASLDPDNGQDGPCIPVPASALVQRDWVGDWWMPRPGLFNIASIDKIKEAICTLRIGELLPGCHAAVPEFCRSWRVHRIREHHK